MKMTDWFPPEVKPVHIGYYHTLEGDEGIEESMFNWYWNGAGWYSCSDCRARCRAQNRTWRGLSEKPE